jgi:hypothetical protein
MGQTLRASEVEIRPNAARFGSTTYQIANVSLVRVRSAKKLTLVTLVLCLLGGAIIWGVLQEQVESLHPNTRLYIGLSGIVAMVAGIGFQLAWPRREYTFSMRVNSGDWETLVMSDQETALRLKRSIEEEFALRSGPKTQ